MRLPRVHYSEKRGTWYSQAYRGTNASTGKRVKRQKDFRAAQDERDAQRMSDVYWTNYDRASGKSCDGTLGGWFLWYLDDLKGKKKDNTHRAYSRNLRNYYSDALLAKRIGDVTKADVREWADNMREEGFSASTCHNALQSLRNVYSFAISHDCDVANVVKEACVSFGSDGTSARALTDDEVARVRRECKSDGRVLSMTLLLAIDIALTTGMRIGEICALRPCDVDLATSTIHVNHNLVEPEHSPVKLDSPKGGKSRNIAIDRGMASRIASVVDGDSPIINDEGTFIRPTRLSRMFTDVRRAAGVDEGVTFHNLRHTHATKLFAAGELLTTVSSRLGHANVSTTLNIYSHVMPGADTVAASKASAFLVE